MGPRIIIDHREFKSCVTRVLYKLGANLEQKSLNVGDYVISNEVCVERKEVSDFVKSLIDNRLFSQIKALKEHYKKPVLLIEGEGSLYAVRNVHPNAIRGALASVILDYGIPIMWTNSREDTAQTLFQMARREQEDKETSFTPHGSNKPMSLKEAQEYLVSAIPHVGSKLGRKLLEEFRTLKKLFTAGEEDLRKVDKIGPKKAKRMKRLFDLEYGSETNS